MLLLTIHKKKLSLKLLSILCFIISCIVSCKKDAPVIIKNNHNITALGHGGMGIYSLYPLDSYQSISKCLNIDYIDGTEFDIQLTKDSVLVVFHNEQLSENTNIEGTINSLNWEELKNAHYTQPRYLNYPIITVDELFSKVENIHHYKFTFDCKLYPSALSLKDIPNYHNTYINAIINIIQKYQLENNIYIESQNEDFLRLFKRKKSDYKLFIYPQTFEEGLAKAQSINLYGITISTKNISKEQIKIAHDNNLRVAIWNVQTFTDNKDAIAKKPDIIQTDRAKDLVKRLN